MVLVWGNRTCNRVKGVKKRDTGTRNEVVGEICGWYWRGLVTMIIEGKGEGWGKLGPPKRDR